MEKRLRFAVVFLILIFSIIIPTPINAKFASKNSIYSTALNPGNTVILSNKFDQRFSKDFSVLLKHLRLEWVVLDSSEVPDSVHDKNLILLGNPDSEYVGQIIREILSAEEIETLEAIENEHLILEKESPWMDDRKVYICSGPEFLHRRNAAEELIRALIPSAPPPSAWIRTSYDVIPPEDVRYYIATDVLQLQYQFATPELPLEDLVIDVDAKSPGGITSQEAAEDVERLFYLLSHGYSGYAFFNQNDAFDLAKKNILEALSSKSSWSSNALASLLHENLSFIVDFHMSIGEYRFAEHSDFWYAPNFDLTLAEDGYQFKADNKIFALEAINESDPTPYILPSLNRLGEPVYRLGLLSKEKPQPLILTASSEGGAREFKVKLERSDFNYYSSDIFREDLIGGIPVIRVRGFGDSDPDELTKFVETGRSLRDEPVVIVDIRGNGGGNERWASQWIQGLTGKRPNSIFVFTELESKTSLIGRANAFVYWAQQGTNTSFFQTEADRHTSAAESIENGVRQTHWTGPHYPQIPLISNHTTVIVITNDYVASAGEGFVMRISQAENVVVVGENTMGALTFGNISTHQLPNSKLIIWLPINLNLFPDGKSREGIGLTPDLWVPAADAVNYAAAAVRQGTITTYQPLSQEALETKFIPESSLFRVLSMGLNFWIVFSVFFVGCVIWAFFMRKKPRIILAIGLIWFTFGWYFVTLKGENPIGYSFICTGIICTIWGGGKMLKERINSPSLN